MYKHFCAWHSLLCDRGKHSVAIAGRNAELIIKVDKIKMFIKGNLIGFSTRFQKGHTLNKGKTPKCCFKKGHIMSEETRRKISLKMVGRSKNDAKNWKGNQADYYTIHKWVHLKKGKPKKCLICGLVGKYVSFKNGEKWNLDWASKDHSYSRNLDDYIPLCKKCHRKYDIDRSQWSGGRPKK